MYVLFRNKKNVIYLLLSGVFSGVSFFMKQPGIITLLIIFACIVIDTFGKEISKHKSEIRKETGYLIQNFEIDPLAPFLCKDIVMSGRIGKIGD